MKKIIEKNQTAFNLLRKSEVDWKVNDIAVKAWEKFQEEYR